MFRERLSAIRDRLSGAKAVALVAADGIRVESVGSENDGVDLEALAALTLAQLQNLAASEEAGLGTPLELTLTGKHLRLLATHIGKGYYLLLVCSEHVSLGRARYEARRARLDFEADLV